MDLFRKGSSELSSVLSGNQPVQFTGQHHQLDPLETLYQQATLVEQQQWHYLVETARPQSLQKKCQEKFSAVPLNVAKTTEDLIETNKLCPAISVSKTSSVSIVVYGVLLILPPNIMCPPQILPQHVSLSQ